MLYISFVKGLFAMSPKGYYHWEEGEGSEIHITNEHPVQSTNIGNRPAVTFTRGPLQFYSLGMDDMMNYNFRTGSKTRGVLIPGVMSINCCSRVSLESERIAFVIAEHLWILREQLIGSGLFYEVGRQPQLSAPSPAEGLVAADNGEEWYCTAVSSPFQFPRMSKFTPLNREVVNSIQFQIQTQLYKLRQRSTGGPAASQNGADVPVHVCEHNPPGFFPQASDVHGRTPDPAGNLPPPPTYATHPLDPARVVRVRTVHPFRPGLRPPSMGGHAIPIADCRVEESNATPPFKTKV